MIETIQLSTDVLVIGAGAAGIRAAIEARKSGVDTIVAAKGCLGFAGSTFCSYSPTWGYQAATAIIDHDDSPEEHLKEIMESACGTADPNLADILVHEAAIRLEDLKKIGLDVDYIDGKPVQEIGCFSHRPRCFMVTGKSRIRDKFISALKSSGAQIIESLRITDLLVKDEVCIGAIGYNSTQIYVIWSKSVILATGGAGNLFIHNFNTSDLIGDGQILALKAGAALMNLEFMQIGFGITYPVEKMLFEGRLLQYGPKFKNTYSEEYLDNYLPVNVSKEDCLKDRAYHMPYSIRDCSMYLDIAAQQEVMAGRGTAHHSIYIDFRNIRSRDLVSTPVGARCYEGILAKGCDISRELLEMAPHIHAMNGGVCIDEFGATQILGLYAAGEVAAGPHGADRLGGNMMPATQVFGTRAGLYAAKHALQMKLNRRSVNEFHDNFDILKSWLTAKNKSIGLLKQLIHELRLTYWQHLLTVRTEAELVNTLDAITNAKKILASSRPGLDGSIDELYDLSSMILLGQAITEACRFRKESRGSHYRADFPQKNNRYACPFKIRLENERIKIDLE
ncbi:MAG TPA: hypothetical protein DDW50_02485 [Firmicutes bacterium]|jgi:fumarate reductase (CoM/CoB) subunit A|nr:hypothetical protein [Bacillota bacterium]